MAQATQISVRVDEEVKRRAESVLDELGLSMTAAITVFLKKVGREHRIPFELNADPFYSENNIRYLEGIMKDIREGKAHFSEHELIEVDD